MSLHVLACDCNETGSVDSLCDAFGGVCSCKNGVGGGRCSYCENGWFNFSSNGCQSTRSHNTLIHTCSAVELLFRGHQWEPSFIERCPCVRVCICIQMGWFQSGLRSVLYIIDVLNSKLSVNRHSIVTESQYISSEQGWAYNTH